MRITTKATSNQHSPNDALQQKSFTSRFMKLLSKNNDPDSRWECFKLQREIKEEICNVNTEKMLKL